MSNKYTTRLSTTTPRVGGLISLKGIKSTNPMIQAQIEAAQKKREEEEREAAERLALVQATQGERKTTNAGVENAMAGLGAAPSVTPVSARMRSTNPIMQAALDDKYAREEAAYAEWDAKRKARQEERANEIKTAGGYDKTADFASFSTPKEDVSDIKYRYINNIGGYRNSQLGGMSDPNEVQKLKFMTDDEIKLYNYIYNKNAAGLGKQLAADYLEELSPDLDRRQAEDLQRQNREYAEAHQIKASAASVPESVIGGVGSAMDLAAQGAKKLVTGEDINYNSRAQQMGRTAEDIRSTVSENIESPVGQFFYDVGMSMADSLAAGMLGPVGGGTLLGMSAGASAARDAAERGGSDRQALIQGVAAGVFEGLFEKYSLGMWKGAKEVPVTGVKSVAKNILKSAGVNLQEEATTELANVLTDYWNMGGMSNYQTSVNAYIAQGISPDKAKKKAAWDVAKQIGMAGLSGAVMGGAFSSIDAVLPGIANKRTGTVAREAGIEGDVIQGGMESAPKTESRKLAERLSAKQAAGKTLTDTEVGALWRENMRQIEDEETAAKEKNAPAEAEGEGKRQYSFSERKIPTYEELMAKPDVSIVDIRGEFDGRPRSEQRKSLMQSEEIKQMYAEPIVNRDTGERVFITPASMSHSFSNAGADNVEAVKHLREIVENAVLTHAETATHGADNVTGVYTLFGAVRGNDGVKPVKVKIKEYVLDGRSIPQNIKQYFLQNGQINPYASVYDNRVLVVEGIEKEDASSSALTGGETGSTQGKYPSASSVMEDASSSARPRGEQGSSAGAYLSASSTISIADLTRLVNSEYQKYLPAEIREKEVRRGMVGLQEESKPRGSSDFSLMQKAVESKIGYGNRSSVPGITNIPQTDDLGNPLPQNVTESSQKPMTQEQVVSTAQRLGAELGREVRFTRMAPPVGGYAQNGRIWVNVDASQPVAHIFAHELTHVAENAEVYDELARMVLGEMSPEKQYSEREYMKKLYRTYGQVLDDRGADAELVAEYVADKLFTDEAAIMDLARRNRNVVLRIYDRIREWAAKVTGDAEKAFLLRAQRLYAKALRQVQGEMEQERRYSVAGDVYSTAREYLRRYEKAETAREVTAALAKHIDVDHYQYSAKIGKIIDSMVNDYSDGIGGAWINLEVLADEFGYSESKKNAEKVAKAMIYQAAQDGYLMQSMDGTVALTQKGLEMAYENHVPEDLQTLRDMYDEGVIEDEARWFDDDTDKAGTKQEPGDMLEQKEQPQIMEETIGAVEKENAEDTSTIAQQKSVEETAWDNSAESIEAEQEQNAARKESEYWYMIDRMMERAANKDAIGDAYSGVSGNIGKLLRREADSVKIPKTTETGRAFAADGSMAEQGITRKMLNSRARQSLEQIEYEARKNIGFALGMTYWADHTETDAAIDRLVTQYLWNGQYAISEADAQRRTNEAFDVLFADAVEKNKMFYEKYQNISGAIAQYVGFDRKDAKKKYHEFRRSEKLEGYEIDDNSIASAYKILREQAPELFPEREGTSIKLGRMLQIASSVEQVKVRLGRMQTEAGYLNEVMRAKVDFAAVINDTLREAELVRRYAEDKRSRVEEMKDVPTDPADLVEIMHKVKALKRDAERISGRYLLTTEDKLTIDRLVRGELKPSEVRSPNKDGILAVYDKLSEVEKLESLNRKYNARRKARMSEAADTALGDLSNTRDKASGIQYSVNTMERNVEDVFKDKTAQAAVRRYFERVHESEATATRAKNAFNERVNAMKISQRVEKGNTESEAYAVQLMGEAMDNIAQLKAAKEAGREVEQIGGQSLADWEATAAKFKEENPNMDWNKITRAVEEFRAIYNELYEQMNRVRVENGYTPIDYRRGYFPHFQKNEPDTIFGKLLHGLGVDADVTPLPTSINGLTDRFKPGIAWFGHAQARQGFATDYDAIEGYQKYIDGALRVIYHTENIQNLRMLESRIRYATTDEGMKERIAQKQKELDESSGMSEDEKDEIMQNLYREGRFTLSGFCNELNEYTNLLAGKKSRQDRGMEALIGRKAYNIMKAMENRLGANMVSLNIGSALTNFIPLQQGYAQLGARRLTKGMFQTMLAKRNQDTFYQRSDFLTNRRGRETVGDKRMDKAQRMAGMLMETIDSLTSETLVRARYMQNMEAGVSEDMALTEADRWAARVMGDRSRGAMPTIFHATNPATKMFTQFQLEVANNLMYMTKDMKREAAEKGAWEVVKVFAKYFLSAWLFNELYEYLFGQRPATDVIGMANEFAGDAFGYELPNLITMGVDAVQGELDGDDFKTEREGIYTATANLFKNVAEQTPFVGGILPMFVDNTDSGRLPISSAVPNIPNIAKAFEKDRAWQDRVELLYKEGVKPLAYLAMPFGGGQLKKSIEGIAAVIKGGSYSYDAQGRATLQYPIYAETLPQTIGAYVRAGTLGKSSFKTAQDWVDSGFESFSATETAVYRGMLDIGANAVEAYDAIAELSDIKKTEEASADVLKREALRKMSLSDDEKAVVYYGLLATDKERELLDEFTQENFSMARAAKVLLEMRDAETTSEKRKILADIRGLGDVEKAMIYRDRISMAWDDEIAAMHEAGFSFDEFLAAQNMLAKCDEETEEKTARDNAFIDWAIGQGYSLNERWVMMDCFGVSTETKKENKKKKFGLTLPVMPQVSLPEIKMQSLPQISLPGFGG